MLKKFKMIFKCMLIYIVLFMIILSNVSYGYSSSDVAGAVAGYAYQLLVWGNQENLSDGGPKLRYAQGDARNHHPKPGEPDPELPWYWDCSSFASNMYDMVTENGVFGGTEHVCTGILSSGVFETTGVYNTDSAPVSGVVPGDLLLNEEHVEIYLGPDKGTGGAHTNRTEPFDRFAKTTALNQVDCGESRGIGPFYSPQAAYFYKLTDSAASKITTLDTTFSMAGTRAQAGDAINYSEFFFNGVPDGKYSLASRSFWQVIIDSLAQVLDFIVNLIFYIVRAVIVGYTAIMENLLSWMINVVSDTNTEDKTLNISSTEASTSDSDSKITVEKIFFNKLELFDINVFSTD